MLSHRFKAAVSKQTVSVASLLAESRQTRERWSATSKRKIIA